MPALPQLTPECIGPSEVLVPARFVTLFNKSFHLRIAIFNFKVDHIDDAVCLEYDIEDLLHLVQRPIPRCPSTG